jgi:hypothetical protein
VQFKIARGGRSFAKRFSLRQRSAGCAAKNAGHVKLQTSAAGIAAATLALVCYASAGSAAPSIAATPPPTPPPINTPATAPTYGPDAIPLVGASSTPIPIPSGFGLPGTSTPKPGSATPSPPPNPRNGLEGVWEMVIQRSTQPEYVHFQLKQTGTALTGNYLDHGGKAYPLTGTVDGQHFRMIVTLPNGTSALLEGRLDGTSDMVGKLTTPQEEAYFTASWRPKEKWIENINASPGGLGGGGGGAGGPGGGGGGYPP